MQRSLLINASSEPAVYKQIESLARASLKAIPEELIGDKQKFFEFIKAQNSVEFELFTAVQNIYRYICNLAPSGSTISNFDLPSNAENNYNIFISYRRDGGDALAGRLADRFTTLGYKVFYDVEKDNCYTSCRSGMSYIRRLCQRRHSQGYAAFLSRG